MSEVDFFRKGPERQQRRGNTYEPGNVWFEFCNVGVRKSNVWFESCNVGVRKSNGWFLFRNDMVGDLSTYGRVLKKVETGLLAPHLQPAIAGIGIFFGDPRQV
jgi:hypothetical protein